MSDNSQWIFICVVLLAIAGTVRSRYRQALHTGKTRSATPLRTYDDLWARLRVRLIWCFLPATAVALWLWFARHDPVVAVWTVFAAAAITAGGGIFDHLLLRAWAKHPPQPQDE